MKNILVFILIISVFANTQSVYGENVAEGDRYISYLDEDNSTQTIDLQQEPDEQLLQSVFDQDYNQYLLSTRRTTVPQRLSTGNVTSINSSDFNSTLITIFAPHGWRADKDNDFYKVIIPDYVTASTAVGKVGKALGTFMAYLVEVTGMSFSDVHCVGFSLGVHACGNAGRYVGGALARITGCDGAGPLFIKENPNTAKSTDANYFEAIHTNGGGFGKYEAYADTDFYANGGRVQPGCNALNFGCNHRRSYQLDALTLGGVNLVGHKCITPYEFEHYDCSGPTLNMGNNDLDKTGYVIRSDYEVDATYWMYRILLRKIDINQTTL